MLKRIDRHDSDERISIQREEAERELKRAEENLTREPKRTFREIDGEILGLRL